MKRLVIPVGIGGQTKELSLGQANNRYVNLLRDTGRMTVEDLAARHLGIDLTQPAFWQRAVDAATAGLDEFLRLTEAL